MGAAKDPLVQFAERVRARRHALGLTQEEVAYRAQMNASYWSRIERAKIDPGLRMIARVAGAHVRSVDGMACLDAIV